MPVIAVSQDPSAIERPTLHSVDNGTNLLEWLIDNIDYPDRLGVTVQLNGDTIADIDEHSEQEFNFNINFELNDRDTALIIFRPRGTEVIAAIVIAVVSLAISLTLTPKPALPNNTGKRTESPNNQLNAATNTFRPRQAIPDIAGQVVSYPDFIQPSYYEYINNLKVVKEIFCIGVGQYLVEEVKTGETMIDDIPGSSYIVHPPGSVPSELLNVRSSNDIDGQVLLPSDDGSLFYSGDIDVINGGITIVTPSSNTVDNLSLQVGTSINIDVSGTDSEGAPVSFSGTVTIAAINSSNSFDISSSIGFTTTDGTGFIEVASEDPKSNRLSTILEGEEINSVWFNVVLPQGIRTESQTVLDLDFNIVAYEIDSNSNDTGTLYSDTVTISGNTLNPQYRTFKLNVPSGRYRAEIYRTTLTQPDGAIDNSKIESIVSVTPYSGANFGDVTLLEVDRRATTQPLAGTQSKINALVTRKLQTFDGGGAFVATRSFADYVYYILSDQAGEPDSQIDTDTLFGIYDGLADPQLGYFDFTFDDSDIGMRERIETACNVARVRYYNLPKPRWNFVREEAQQVRVAMFNRRNILPASSSQVYKFQRTADFDSVQVRYTDPDNNTEAVINRAWNGTSIISGEGFRPIEIDLAGCRNVTQATNRADLEIRKLVYQRRRVNDTVMNEGQFIGLGQLIQWADPNDQQIFAGEVAGFDGVDTFDTFERVNLKTGVTYFVNITDNTGAVSNTATVTARTDTDYGFIASGLSGAYVASGAVQLGSKYFIYKNGELTDLLVTAIDRPDERGNVAIEGVEYVAQVFEQD